jgi:hypothetical protein
MPKKVNRRNFLSRAVAGAGVAALSACSKPTSTPSKQAAEFAGARVGTLSTTTRTPLLAEPKFFEPLSKARQFAAAADENRVPLRMIIRGLYAVVIREREVDIILMDSRKHQMDGEVPAEHVGKFSVEDRFAVLGPNHEPLAEGLVEVDHTAYEPIRAWDIRGSIVEFSTDSPLDDSERIAVIERPEIPWSSMGAQLDFERVYPPGQLRSPEDMETTAADGAIVGIIRLTHGYLESALPARRYGNTGVWEVAQAGNVAEEKRERWTQGLSDTVLYSLDLPRGDKKVTLTRRPLGGYAPGAGAPQPSLAPIVLAAPATKGDVLPCGITHEPKLGEGKHTDNLPHNHVFYNLFDPVPPRDVQTVPSLLYQWVDRGVGRESRSAFWAVTRDPNNGNQLSVNLCDPNCNGAVFGLAAWRARQPAAAGAVNRAKV